MKTSKRNFVFTVFFLTSILIGPGLLSIVIGQDANWDLRNYHIYVPYSVVNDRIGVDIADWDSEEQLADEAEYGVAEIPVLEWHRAGADAALEPVAHY